MVLSRYDECLTAENSAWPEYSVPDIFDLKMSVTAHILIFLVSFYDDAYLKGALSVAIDPLLLHFRQTIV